MNPAGTLLFIAAYATAVALPGPGLASLVARVLARGRRGIGAYILGFAVGDLMWFSAAATGLSAAAASFSPVIAIIRFAGAAYLLFIAYRIVTADPAPIATVSLEPQAGTVRNFTAGLAITLGNPKIIVFFVALLPSVLDLRQLTLWSGVVIGALMVVTLGSILGAYALLANRARGFFRSRRALKRLNLGTGAVMAGAALAIAAKQR